MKTNRNGHNQKNDIQKTSKLKTEAFSYELGKCSFGHKKLRDVPILYGDGAVSRKDQKELKAWAGGCLISPEKNKVVCSECGYAYDVPSDSWAISVLNFSELFIKPYDIILNFPCPKDIKDDKMCSQAVRKEVKIFEKISLNQTKVSPEQIWFLIEKYLKQCKLKYNKREIKEQDGHMVFYTARFEEQYLLIRTNTSILYTNISCTISTKKQYLSFVKVYSLTF